MSFKHYLKKYTSFLLAALMIVQCGYFVMPTVSAATSATASDDVLLGDVKLDYTQTLRDNKDGTYTLELVLDAQTVHKDANEDAQISRNGYFTAPADGKYLVEIWGGNGGDGVSPDPGLLTGSNPGDGGNGGQGGHVYGIVTLKKGETLFYTLGGHGGQTTGGGDGGGVNGDGGNSGSITLFTVGGGGGYSAVFKYGVGEFESGYFNADGEYSGNAVSETHRISRYIMIAGGGGGGGAGSGSYLASDNGWPPNGGDAGSIGGTAVPITNGTVNGTVFAGSNGSSSSTNTDYVGEGGTDVPPKYSSTWPGIIDAEQANDWAGIENPDLTGGSGGACNLRGGAGGAGYAGGGGGIMTSAVVPTAVGGGGGGSSFVAEGVDYASVNVNDLDKTSGSTTGGAITIQALDIDTSYLNSVNVSYGASNYFDITSDNAGGITSANLNSDDPLTIILTLKPKDGFAGGNNVPLLANDLVTVTAGAHTAQVYLKSSCRYANVPLNFKVTTHDQTYDLTQTSPVPPTVVGMYTDDYASVRGNLTGDWRYDFISSIGEYTVTDNDGNVLTGEVTPDVTTKYNVSFVVTPKSGAAATVGEPVVTTTVSGLATVTVTLSGELELNGNMLDYTKTLTNNSDGTFTLSLNFASDFTQNYAVTSTTPTKPTVTTYTSTPTDPYMVPETGYYFFEAWGANGGKGKDLFWDGGQGGSGGYVSGFVYLEEGQQLAITVGTNGNDASGIVSDGKGGGYSAVAIQGGNPFLIAAGGSGGQGAFLGYGGTTGGSPSRDNDAASTELAANLTDYNGLDGSETARNNYRNSGEGGIVDKAGDYALDENNKITGNSEGTAAAVKITCLQVTPLIQINPAVDTVKAAIKAALENYSFASDISKYFDVTASAVSVTGTDTDAVIAVDSATGKIDITDIDPTVTYDTPSTAVGNHTLTGSVEFTISITLSPKDGFLGGNDVPLLAYGEPNSTDNTTSMVLSQGTDSADIPRESEKDFVNINVPDGAANSTFNVVKPEPEVIRGTVVDIATQLYTVSNFVPPTGEEAWKADFVSFTTTLTEKDTGTVITGSTLAPEVTTDYVVTCTVEPKAENVKALDPAATGDTWSTVDSGQRVVIFILPVVEYILTNMTAWEKGVQVTEMKHTIDADVDFQTTLAPYPDTIYVLPDSITVTVTGESGTVTLAQGSGYTYNPATGAVVVFAASIGYDHVTITAEGIKKEPLSITYLYMTDPDKPDQMAKKVVGGEGDVFLSGAELNDSNIGKPQEGMDYTVPDGYTYQWVWGNGATTYPTYITENLYAIGSYVPNFYPLTIRYIDDLGNELQAAETVQAAYGSEYSYTAPEIAGYTPQNTVISGKMDSTEGKTIIFRYVKSAGQLNILYLYPDGTQAAPPHQQEIKVGESYEVSSPDTITGHYPDQAAVTVISVTQDQVNNGINVTVTYLPELYTITFDPDEGSCDITPHTVEYHNVYGFDPTTPDKPSPLPVPVKPGYNFAGWYLPDGTTKVTDSTLVEITEDTVLTAHWTEIEKFTLTIRYIYKENNLVAAPPYTAELAPGADYSVASPSITDYVPSASVVEGTMGNRNEIVLVTYSKTAKTLTVEYCFSDGMRVSPAQLGIATNPYVVELEPGTEFTTPAVNDIEGYTTPGQVTGTMGSDDRTITLYYEEEDVPEVVSVTIEWGTLTYTYEQGAWQPETHTYDAPTITPSEAEKNTITVTNNEDSTIPVSVSIRYEKYSNTEGITGHFTDLDEAWGPSVTQWTLGLRESKTVYLWLGGKLDLIPTDPEIGRCIVTITRAGGS